MDYQENLVLDKLFVAVSGEAKNLPGGGCRDSLCKVMFDQEPIFNTATVEKSVK